MVNLFKDPENPDHFIVFSCCFALFYFLVGSIFSTVLGLFLIAFAVSAKILKRDFDSYMIWASLFLHSSKYSGFQDNLFIVSILTFVSIVLIGVTALNIFDSLPE